MSTIKFSVDIPADRRVELVLPPGTPTGKAEVVVTIDSPAAADAPARTSLADWADQNAEHWGNAIQSSDVEGFTGRRF